MGEIKGEFIAFPFPTAEVAGVEESREIPETAALILGPVKRTFFKAAVPLGLGGSTSSTTCLSKSTLSFERPVVGLC